MVIADIGTTHKGIVEPGDIYSTVRHEHKSSTRHIPVSNLTSS